ncbi:MAG: signal peptidase I [Haloferacaceae archaeon]
MFRQLGVALALGAVLLAVAPAGSPVQVSYVYSDSMEPTIGTNDGFLVVPAGSIDEGDVITYRAAKRDTYVTHRVVGRSASGFVTKGDNNPTTDQAVGYAHVERSDVLGAVLTYRGEPVTIPAYGTAVGLLREYGSAVLAVLGLLFVCQSVRTSQLSRGTPQVPRVGGVLTPVFTASVLAAIGLMLAGTAVHQLAFVAVATPTGASNTIAVGESKTTTVVFNRSASPLTRSVIAAENMRITDRTRNASNIVVTARIPPPESTGRHAARLTVRRYPAVLAPSQFRRLERIHPVIPAGIAALVMIAPLYVLARLALDWRMPIRPARSKWLRRLEEALQ